MWFRVTNPETAETIGEVNCNTLAYVSGPIVGSSNSGRIWALARQAPYTPNSGCLRRNF